MPKWLEKLLYSLNPARLSPDDLMEVWYVEFLSAEMLMSDEEHTIAGRVQMTSVPASEIGLTGTSIPFGLSASDMVTALIVFKSFKGTDKKVITVSKADFEAKFKSIPVKTAEELVDDGLNFLKLFEEHYDKVQAIIDEMRHGTSQPEL